MKISLSLTLPLVGLLNAARGDSVPWERLEKNNSLLLIVDMQVGLYHMVRDFDPTVYRQAMMGHAELAKVFDLPVIMTTSAEEGPNGPLPKEMIEMYPDAPLIKRGGEINAWDNAEFRAAVKATGKTQIIIGGIVTEVCTAFLALSLRSEGYSVFANVEASGTTSELSRDTANSRMEKAGVHLVSLFGLAGDLLRDWRSPPGAAGVVPFFDKYLPLFSYLARAHGAAVQNGALIPGQAELLLEG